MRVDFIYHDRATLQHLRLGENIRGERCRGAPPVVSDSLRDDHCFVLCLCVHSGISMMSSTKWWACAVLIVCMSVRLSSSAPAPQDDPPMPYEYKYDVEDQEKALYFGANEAGDAQGKVIGGYKVLLPDGRLMSVEYTVEGESGFVPKITFEDNANPFGKGK